MLCETQYAFGFQWKPSRRSSLAESTANRLATVEYYSVYYDRRRDPPPQLGLVGGAHVESLRCDEAKCAYTVVQEVSIEYSLVVVFACFFYVFWLVVSSSDISDETWQ